ncbi:MAG: hypothetical protein ABL958_20800, partial [Bdellovibrionia bacterium]
MRILVFLLFFATTAHATSRPNTPAGRAATETSGKGDELRAQVLGAIQNQRYFDAQTISLVGLSLFNEPGDKS